MLNKKKHHRPFLKWAGNKFRCLNHIIQHFPQGKRLIEPFAGSGAIFLNTTFEDNILGEHNPHLVRLYQFLQKEPDTFIDYCQSWFIPENNQKSRYYELRSLFNESQDLRLKAALFLYLNRHGFNGLCRFNLKGLYNVPFGSYQSPYFPKNEMLEFAKRAQKAQFIHSSYQDTFQKAQHGDVIYCDPPYYPLSKTACFTSYTHQAFKDSDQIHLIELAIEATQKGAHVFISNHDTAFIRNHYYKAQKIHAFQVPRTISSKGHKRQAVAEILAYFGPTEGF
jgi:DNA adenine methylase